MKRNELKKVLKPLIKECIKEVIFEEGVLSGLISEVMKGAKVNSLAKPIQKEFNLDTLGGPRKKPQQKLQEVRQKMSKAIGEGSYNGIDLFEGTEPLKRAGSVGESAATSPLGTYAPGDAGVDISAIFSPNWKKLV